MNKLQIQIHELLKKKYEAASGCKMVTPKGLLASRNRFVFENVSDNLYEPMSEKVSQQYRDAGGEEALEKMHSLRSSAAMTYNIFGNDTVRFAENPFVSAGEYNVCYEAVLETVPGAKVQDRIDAVISNEKEIDFFEMKLFEPLYHKTSFVHELSSSLEDAQHYAYTDSAFPFMESIRRMRGSGIVRYDACQMFNHALGIYNYIRKNELAVKGKKIKLINCIWTMENPFGDEEEKLRREFDNVFFEEKTEFAKFKECMFNVVNLFEKKGIDFTISLVELRDLLQAMEVSEEKRSWLNRYL